MQFQKPRSQPDCSPEGFKSAKKPTSNLLEVLGIYLKTSLDFAQTWTFVWRGKAIWKLFAPDWFPLNIPRHHTQTTITNFSILLSSRCFINCRSCLPPFALGEHWCISASRPTGDSDRINVHESFFLSFFTFVLRLFLFPFFLFWCYFMASFIGAVLRNNDMYSSRTFVVPTDYKKKKKKRK